MPFIGPIIKKVIDIKNAITPLAGDAVKSQKAQLRILLEKAQDTAFGKYYGFRNILQQKNFIRTFQEEVPVHQFEDISPGWWRQQQRLPDITWPGKPRYFALTSGTTGKGSKRIPVTDDMLSSFRQVGIAQIQSLANYDLPAEFFEKDILLLSSSANLKRRADHLEGEISGINSSNIPSWFEAFYKPGLEIAQLDSWEERVSRIAQQAQQWDVGAIAGIPLWVKKMLEKIIDHHKLDTIHDIWPSLMLFASGGVNFEPYRKSFDQLMSHPIHYADTYLASEGFFAFTARPGTMDMQLALQQGIFYEFIPFDESSFDEYGNLKEDPVCLTIDQVHRDKEYAMLVSTPAGAWRYMIGDLVKFTDIKQYEIVLSGRTKYYLNVAGSQLSEEKINTAVEELSEQSGININEFAVAALKDEQGEFFHQWVLGASEQMEEPKAAQDLDDILKKLNKGYRDARKKALKDISITMVHTDRIYDWLEEKKKKGGQVKLPKVMKEEDMRDLLAFLR